MFAILIVSLGVVLYFTLRSQHTPIPYKKWKLFDLPLATNADVSDINLLEGVYAVDDGHEVFGRFVILKISYTGSVGNRIHHLSFLCENDCGYIICEARKLNEKILFSGYWLKPARGETGTVRLMIDEVKENNNQRKLIAGRFGYRQSLSKNILSFSFRGPIKTNHPFHIISHRGCGRNLDFTPYSENTIEAIKLASQIGATGVEIDVRLTSDKIPIIFHDPMFSPRTIQDSSLYFKYVADHYLNTIKSIRLKKGEQIPTLREALDAILYQTPLELVWLDVKYAGDLQPLRNLQLEYLQRAKDEGRHLEIVFGIGDEDVLNQFKKLDGYTNIPSLCELELETAIVINSEIWAPRWPGGLKNDEVDQFKKLNKRAFVWTIDAPEIVHKYLHEGHYDGMLTNFPPLVYYSYYIAQ